jgi:DNA-binding MarR family transcriptional regulator
MLDKTAAFDDLGNIGFLLHDVSRLRRTVLDRCIKHLKITRSQWWILSNISRSEAEGICPSELARLLEINKAPLGSHISRLEKNGFVYRAPDKNNRRVTRIFMSDAGRALMKKLEVIAKRMHAESTRDISELEQQWLVDKLRTLKGTLRVMDVPVPD